MTDIDYCKGDFCAVKSLCRHYKDFLYRKEKGYDTRYAMNLAYNKPESCPHYIQAEYYGG